MTLPFNNQQVLDNPELSKDRFLLLGELDWDAASGVYNITVQPDGPIVALNTDDQAQIEQESGVVVPLRKAWDNKEARAQYGLPENLRMIGAGGIVSIQIGNARPLTVLFEKTAGPSKGRMAQASGLSDRNPLQTAWAEIAEETGIVMVDRRIKQLEVVLPTPWSFKNRSEKMALFQEQQDAKYGQAETIRRQLPEDVCNWSLDLFGVQGTLSPEDEPYMDVVRINLPGHDGPLEARFLVSDSDKTANVNLLLPVRLQLPEDREIICVDPEEFMRPVQLFTRQEMLTRDFIDNKSSVPMRPYLEKARAREVKPDAVPQGDKLTLDF